MLQRPLPQQIEFSRLNMTYTVMSKRFLLKLVQEKYVDGWDDPRMPTLVGARRRGFTPEGFRMFAERIGVSKADNSIDPSVLEDCMREHLNEVAPRRIAVLDPLKLLITNYPEGKSEECFAPNHPQKPELGQAARCPFSRELWIEREDFNEEPPKGYFRLFPGNTVRLKYGFVVKCTGCTKDAHGKVIEVMCEYIPDSKSGTPGADHHKTKGVIHWVSAAHAYEAEVRLYDRLFKVPNPGEGDGELPRRPQSGFAEGDPGVPGAFTEGCEGGGAVPVRAARVLRGGASPRREVDHADGDAAGFWGVSQLEADTASMRYWWVNQNQTYRHEVSGGYLWSPKRKKNGRRKSLLRLHARSSAWRRRVFVCRHLHQGNRHCAISRIRVSQARRVRDMRAPTGK